MSLNPRAPRQAVEALTAGMAWIPGHPLSGASSACRAAVDPALPTPEMQPCPSFAPQPGHVSATSPRGSAS